MEIGFIGLGNMGLPMTMRLVAAGHRPVVLDTRAEAMEAPVSAGASAATSPEEVGGRADIVFLCLPKPELVDRIATAVATGGRAKTIVDLSTTGPAVETELAGRLREGGIALVDCPISGGPGRAEAGTISLMASGEPEALARARPLLDIFGNVFVVGDKPGLSQVVKLLNNLLSFTALVATSEVLALGRKSGLEMDVMIEVINASTGRNSATQEKFPRAIMTGGYNFGGAIAIAGKDAALCLQHARAMGVEMPVGEAVADALTQVIEKYGENADITYSAMYAAERAGVRFSPE